MKQLLLLFVVLAAVRIATVSAFRGFRSKSILRFSSSSSYRRPLAPLWLRRDNDDEDKENFGDEDSIESRIDRKLSNRFEPQVMDRTKVKRMNKSNRPNDNPGNNLNTWDVINRAVFAGIFIAGIGAGITIDSAINTNPKDLASRDAIDKNAPNPKLCATYGSSAMVLDQRVFVTFNPFNIYVTQADTKPGCVSQVKIRSNLKYVQLFGLSLPLAIQHLSQLTTLLYYYAYMAVFFLSGAARIERGHTAAKGEATAHR